MDPLQETIRRLKQELKEAQELQRQQKIQENERKNAFLQAQIKKQEALKTLQSQKTTCLHQRDQQKSSLENEQKKYNELSGQKTIIENQLGKLDESLQDALAVVEKIEEEKRHKIEQKTALTANTSKTNQNIAQLSLAIENSEHEISEIDEKIKLLSATSTTTASSLAEVNKASTSVATKNTSSKKRSSDNQSESVEKKSRANSNSSAGANANAIFNTKLTPKGKLPRELGNIIGTHNTNAPEYLSARQLAMDARDSSTNLPSQR